MMGFEDVHGFAVRWLADQYNCGKNSFEFKHLHSRICEAFGLVLTDGNGRPIRPVHQNQTEADRASAIYGHIASLPTRLVEEGVISPARADQVIGGQYTVIGRYKILIGVRAAVAGAAPQAVPLESDLKGLETRLCNLLDCVVSVRHPLSEDRHLFWLRDLDDLKSLTADCLLPVKRIAFELVQAQPVSVWNIEKPSYSEAVIEVAERLLACCNKFQLRNSHDGIPREFFSPTCGELAILGELMDSKPYQNFVRCELRALAKIRPERQPEGIGQNPSDKKKRQRKMKNLPALKWAWKQKQKDRGLAEIAADCNDRFQTEYTANTLGTALRRADKNNHLA